IQDGQGKFPQVAGLKYSFDASVAPNEGRLKTLEVMENGGWQPIDEARIYTIATNNFVRGGGDGYSLFASNAQNAYDYGPGLEQVVADYLAANRPYTPKLDGRITQLAAASPAEPAAPAEPAPAAPAQPASPAPAEAAPAPAAGPHTIAAGDTFWDLAERYYVDGAKWRAIADANPELRPRRLPIGETLTIPPAG